MPQVLLTDSISVELGAQEPWPEDVKFFQPLEVEQILLPDSASCLSVQAFLKMCGLPYTVEMRANAEHMSPSTRVPFIRAGAFVVAELDPVVAFVANKGKMLTDHLDTSQKADMRAYMALINSVLVNSEMYVSWIHKETYETVTKPRYGSVYPWPLNRILTYQKSLQIAKKLKVLGWKHKTIEEIYTQVDNCCKALSERLDNQTYFFGSKPTELDALVFGHLYTLLTTPILDMHLGSIVRKYENLAKLCQLVDREYFSRTPSSTRSGSNGNGEDYDKLDDISQLPMN